MSDKTKIETADTSPLGGGREGAIKLKINNKEIEVQDGSTILDAAKLAGFEIPTMCHHEDLEHFTSCMICLVKNKQNGKLIASCSIKAVDDMDIDTLDEEITEARKTGLELLLSDHVGDCEAPCTMACPAHMDIPLMNRLLAAGKFDEALTVVKKDIALPSVLGHICPAPCEGVCRRKPMDGAVSICLLKRFSGDEGKSQEKAGAASGKKVAIIGSGPAGLAAAYHLQMKGHSCTVFEKEESTGGILLEEVKSGKLPLETLQREIGIIEKLGVAFKQETIDKSAFEGLQKEYDAVLVASGKLEDSQQEWGLKTGKTGFEANAQNYQTATENTFVAGSALKPTRLVIRILAQGKEAAESIHQFLNKKKVVGQPLKFNSKFGKLLIPEYAQYLKESLEGSRIEPAEGLAAGLSPEEVKAEAARCLHCDCRKITNCKLRDYSDEYGAVQKRFDYSPRNVVQKDFHTNIVYEPEKCIKCGICVRLTEKHGEKFGFTYIGRGFDVKVGIPFHEDLNAGLQKVADKVAEECPTGALAKK